MKKIFINIKVVLIFQIGFGNLSFAQTNQVTHFLLQHPQVPNLDFRSTVRALRPALSYSEFWLQKNLKTLDTSQLMQHFENGQREFLTGAFEPASEHFEAAFALKHEQDWDQASRKIIFYCQLRRAQLLHSHGQVAAASEAMAEAIVFAPDLNMDTQLFAPPLQELFREQQNLLKNQIIDFKYHSGDFDFLVINGLKYSLQQIEPIRIYPGLQRWSWVSSKYAASTYVLGSQEQMQTQPNKAPLLSGNCHQPAHHLAASKADHTLTAVYPDECLREFKNKNWVRPKAKDSVNLQPEQNLATERSENSVPILMHTEAKTPFYHKKWFWIAVGLTAVTSAIIVYNSQQESKSAANNSSGEKTIIPVHN